jgi:3',5'-nucleoside bisphosphate phosphatase
MRLDLHLHTTASDGQYSPTELVNIARQHRLDIIAITDHDTTDGIAEAQTASNGSPFVIPGIEMSAEDEHGDVHMLGYFVDRAVASFQAVLADFREQREGRARKIVEKLAALNMPIEWERVQATAGDAGIGRPHIARAMMERGYVESVRDAFERYLYDHGPAFVSRYKLSPEEAIRLIHSAHGVAVLAHPGLLPDPVSMVRRLVPAGLDGVEINHPDNPEQVRLNMRGLAREHDLVMTGGSDFHGAIVSETRVPGCENPPADAVQRLQERAKRYQA